MTTKEELTKTPYKQLSKKLDDLGVSEAYTEGEKKGIIIEKALSMIEDLREKEIISKEKAIIANVDKPQDIGLTKDEESNIKDAILKPMLSKEEIEKQIVLVKANLSNGCSLSVNRILTDKIKKLRRDLETYNK